MLSDLLFFNDTDYFFHRPMLERQGYYWIEKEGKAFLLLNVLGVDDKDIDVQNNPASNGKQCLTITGNTHNEVFNKDFSVKMSFIINEPMKEVKWKTSNGFMTLEITFEEPVKPAVKILKG